jgi:integrase
LSVKGSHTTADYLPWDEMTSLLGNLERDKRYMLLTLISVGSYTGLRISDLLRLRWVDLLQSEHLELHEVKTKKYRKIKINTKPKRLISTILRKNKTNPERLILFNEQTGKSYSRQHLNRLLKGIKREYKLSISNFSTHSFRKTFGRRIWHQDNYSEKSLILLSLIFNHADTQVTRKYLGITDEEIQAVYDLL